MARSHSSAERAAFDVRRLWKIREYLKSRTRQMRRMKKGGALCVCLFFVCFFVSFLPRAPPKILEKNAESVRWSTNEKMGQKIEEKRWALLFPSNQAEYHVSPLNPRLLPFIPRLSLSPAITRLLPSFLFLYISRPVCSRTKRPCDCFQR